MPRTSANPKVGGRAPTPVRRYGYADQIADLLRDDIVAGRWPKSLPGLRRLSEDYGVARQTLRAALGKLAARGEVIPGESGKPYTVVRRGGCVRRPRLPVAAILMMRPETDEDMDTTYGLRELTVRLRSEGFGCSLLSLPRGTGADKSAHLRRLVESTEADIWMPCLAGENVLRWFLDERIPVLALGGHHDALDIPTIFTDLQGAIVECTGMLVQQGHRRITFIAPESVRSRYTVRSVRDALTAAGIHSGAYNLPDWEESPEGLERLLDSLFVLTPPTALVCLSLNTALGARAYLKRRGLRIPQDVSLVVRGDATTNRWLFPETAYTRFDDQNPVYNAHVVRWLRDFAEGRHDTSKHRVAVGIQRENTTGPAPGVPLHKIVG